MPLVHITYNTKKKTRWEFILNILHKKLPEIVAQALFVTGVRGYGPTLKDVELRFHEAHGHDRGKDLRIVVRAEYLPERAKDHQERTGEIATALDALIGEYVEAGVSVELLDIKFANM